MEMNIFEGGRRVTKVILVISSLTIVGYALFHSPYGSGTFMVYNANGEFIDENYAPTKCDYDEDLAVRVAKELPVTGNVDFKLCFVAMEFDNGKILIPYKFDAKKDFVWGETKTSEKVTSYVEAAKKRFAAADINGIETAEDWWLLKISFILFAVISSAVCCFVLVIVTNAIGWIIRGFMNIPSGKDYRHLDRLDEI